MKKNKSEKSSALTFESEDAFDRLGSNLQKAREHKGLTLAALAKRCGIAESNLCAYESGQNMTVNTLMKLAKALEITFDSLLGDAKTLFFDSGKPDQKEADIANAIEFLVANGVLIKKRIPEEYPQNMDVYAGEGAFSFLDPGVLADDRISAGSSPFNCVLIAGRFSAPALRYISFLEKNMAFVITNDEREMLLKMQKTILINELKGRRE